MRKACTAPEVKSADHATVAIEGTPGLLDIDTRRGLHVVLSVDDSSRCQVEANIQVRME